MCLYDTFQTLANTGGSKYAIHVGDPLRSAVACQRSPTSLQRQTWSMEACKSEVTFVKSSQRFNRSID